MRLTHGGYLNPLRVSIPFLIKKENRMKKHQHAFVQLFGCGGHTYTTRLKQLPITKKEDALMSLYAKSAKTLWEAKA